MSADQKNTNISVEISEPYWDGARNGVLVLQRCFNCGKARHYPRVLCDACYSSSITHFESSGAGEVYSWTVTHHAFQPDFAADVPYVLLTVDMDDGVRVLGRLNEGTNPRVGLRVQLTFAANDAGVPVPWFSAVPNQNGSQEK